jgi:xylulokinase
VTARVLAYDVGTSGVKAVLTDDEGRILASRQAAYGLQTGHGGWVDQDLGDILAALARATRELLASVDDAPVDAIAVTAQMFNLVAVDRDGQPLLPMLSWLDQRATVQAEMLSRRLEPAAQFARFGSIITAKDVIPKILWLREERPDVWRRTHHLLDCKEAIVAHLTGSVAMDPAGATAFRLFDLVERDWSAAACLELGIERGLLADVRPATSVLAGLGREAATALGLRAGIPVVVGAGDVPASQVGAGAIRPGDAHVSLGTAVYFGITVDRPVIDPAGQLGVIGHVDPDLWILWLEVATGGGALTWLLRMLGSAEGDEPGPAALAEVDRLVESATGMDDLLFAPWLSGERVPVFDDRARGAFVGLGLNHGRGHLMRALMEGVAHQMRWALEYATDFGVPIGEIRGVGGGCIGTSWTQIIADALGRPLLSMSEPQDAAARGAAATALVGLGVQPDLSFTRRLAEVERIHEPNPGRVAELDGAHDRFRRLYDALHPIYHDRPATATKPREPAGPGPRVPPLADSGAIVEEAKAIG